MIENLDNLLTIIDDSSFPDKTKRHLKTLIGLELSGKGQKEFRDFIKEIGTSDSSEESS
jgi:hypothetical protein